MQLFHALPLASWITSPKVKILNLVEFVKLVKAAMCSSAITKNIKIFPPVLPLK